MRRIIFALLVVLGILIVLRVAGSSARVRPEMMSQPTSRPTEPATVVARAADVTRRARWTDVAAKANPPPVHFRHEWPFGPDEPMHADQRRNTWEELQLYIEDAKLTPEQRARFLADLADLADLQHEYDDKLTASRAPPPPGSTEAHQQMIAALMEERLAYLTDEQWRLLQRRYGSGWSFLPLRLASGHILARGLVKE